MPKQCIHYFIEGKVQGVWFRASAQEQARALSITGWAKNLTDGRVEITACGEQPAIEAFQDWLNQGPPNANVTSVTQEEAPLEEFEDFEVLR